MTTTITDRIAAAPISWGVCEVPDWGYQLDPDQVLGDMRRLGVAATEFGPEGFLPQAPAERAQVLRDYGLKAVGGFFPLVLHKTDHDPLPEIEAELDAYVAAGATTVIYSAVSGEDGYDERVQLDDGQWDVFFANLDRARAAAESRGITATLHPHVGTLIESSDDVERVLGRSTIGLTLDTGHLFIGGTDPLQLAREHGDRIRHTHLKDVDNAMAQRVRDGELTYYQAVVQGMYRPLGQGDARIGDIVQTLEDQGYQGWYTMEQDTVLPDVAAVHAAVADVAESIEFLRSLDRS
ncbi:sugar phosphate isomerase/epimerase family protein [Pseudoclavibacter sp. 13-3]|uniref:sugar phosphate isomerase/epimerase family protein n=1 Tax=Pseudoclavibacter sp. 13-3 TaxID=2901228 RepID=UPI001E51EAC7|nr:sugar phosphate isomerase/epimerase [Pseudoclavibacter sp. 13-3]MCD7101580.1 sugar phosphate isomerase/epimerase [Pseudoclavibacter sp. 13-3]